MNAKQLILDQATEESQEVIIGLAIKLASKKLRDALINSGHHQALKNSDVQKAFDEIQSNSTKLISMHTL